MSIIQNTNYMSVNNFQFDVLRLPDSSFFVKALNLPGVSMNAAAMKNPFSYIPFAGDHPDFDPLRVTFYVDEEMNSYTEIFTWWQGLVFPNKYDQYKALSVNPKSKNGLYSDITIGLLDSKSKLVKSVQFTNAFPTSIGPIDFAYTNTDSNWASFTATFTYETFDFV